MDRPILFSGAMVRALLAGRKTQTRHVLSPQPPADMGLVGIYAPGLTAVFGYETPDSDHNVALRYMPGDRLWVRESGLEAKKARLFKLFAHDANSERYWVDTDGGRYGASRSSAVTRESMIRSGDWKVRPSIHMPRWASRLTLIVTDVKVERLQSCSTEDARAEGIPEFAGDAFKLGLVADDPHAWHEWDNRSSVENYRALWDHLNADRGLGWDTNPWVVAVSFTVEQRNIDQVA